MEIINIIYLITQIVDKIVDIFIKVRTAIKKK